MIDNERVASKTKAYKKIPLIPNFGEENGVNSVMEMIKENYDRFKGEAKLIVSDELERIRNDDNLRYLLRKEE